MSKTVVRTEAAPAPFQVAPYSQAIRAGDFVFVSGQLALRPGEKELLGGTRGCTHHVEMLGAMATVAHQTMWGQLAREKNQAAEAGSARRPALLDTCYAFASDGEVVKKSWPAFYTGPSDEKS